MDLGLPDELISFFIGLEIEFVPNFFEYLLDEGEYENSG